MALYVRCSCQRHKSIFFFQKERWTYCYCYYGVEQSNHEKIQSLLLRVCLYVLILLWFSILSWMYPKASFWSLSTIPSSLINETWNGSWTTMEWQCHEMAVSPLWAGSTLWLHLILELIKTVTLQISKSYIWMFNKRQDLILIMSCQVTL